MSYNKHNGKGKLIIVTAPSGAGKTTIVKHLIDTIDEISFSISATTRLPRNNEKHGEDYYFLTIRDFLERVDNGDFLEWEEVYQNQYYGTLKEEVDRLWSAGKHIIFDIDVKGATQLRSKYPDRSLTIFIKPPSVEILLDRLQGRRTDSKEGLKKRIRRAKKELMYESAFEAVVVNKDLDKAFADAEKIVKSFIFD